MTEPNTKRKLISRKLVDVSSLVAELRSKNPKDVFVINDAFDEGYSKGFHRGWDACIDELEKMLKEERK